MTRRRRNPRGQGDRLREQLLRAAAAALDEVGDADKVSVRAIASRAGVSPTALYLQFPDRDSLVTAAVDAGFEAFNQALLAAAEEAEPRDRLRAMGCAYLEFAERQPALYAILFSTRRTPGEQSQIDREQALDGLIALLREQDPALDAAAARELALVVWSSLHGFALLRTARPHMSWPTAEAFVRRTLAANAGLAA